MDDEQMKTILETLGIDNINPQGRDSLDFHDIHIEALKQALEEAYSQGKRDARRDLY